MKITIQCGACGAPMPVEQGEAGNVRTREVTAGELLTCTNCGTKNRVEVRVRVRAEAPTQGEFWGGVVDGLRKRTFLDP